MDYIYMNTVCSGSHVLLGYRQQHFAKVIIRKNFADFGKKLTKCRPNRHLALNSARL